MRARALLTLLLLVIVAASGGIGLAAGAHSAIAQAATPPAVGPEIAVYNQGLALVRDTRSVDLQPGVQLVTIRDVAGQLDPTSVHFRSLTDPEGTAVLEQNFEYDLVGPDRLLSKYIDQEIRVVTADGTTYAGTLLSSSGDIILQDADGQVLVVNRQQVRDFAFPSLPEGLITRPSLVWLVDAAQAGNQDIELTYLTGGISWWANYVLLLDEAGDSLDLDGWVTLDNRSGATYQDAKLKLIAGDINRVQPAMQDMLAKGAPAATPEAEMVDRSFFEYHLYEVQRPVTVKDNQTKQIEFVSGTDVPVEQFYVYEGAPGYYFWGGLSSDPSYGAQTGAKEVRTFLSFRTGTDGIDARLPQGIVRVYQRDVDGSALLLGEDSIGHTARDETVQLYIGNAFDIVGERVQTDFRQLGRNAIEESFRITLRNHKPEDIEVRVVERMFRWSEWEITEESAEHTKVDSQTAEWRVPVPAEGEATITYTVRYRW